MTMLTKPQLNILDYLNGYGGRMTMARYDKPVFGDYGPSIRRLLRRRMIAVETADQGFPQVVLTDVGIKTLRAYNRTVRPVA